MRQLEAAGVNDSEWLHAVARHHEVEDGSGYPTGCVDVSDLAIFQVVRKDADSHTAYGVQRAANTAITAYLVAQRLGWTAEEMEKVFKIALTMNISMLELQGRLAHVEGQWHAKPDAVLDGGEIGRLHGGRHSVIRRRDGGRFPS